MARRTLSIGGATEDLFIDAGTERIGSVRDRAAFVLPLGEKIRIRGVRECAGGGACNTAVGLARLGCSAGFCGVVGADQWGQALRDAMMREGVDLACVTVVEGEATSFSLILTSGGDRTILYTPGANEHLHDVTFDRETAAAVDWVYLNRTQEQGCVIHDDLTHALAASSAGLTWNPGGCQIDAGMDAPNHRELLRHTRLLLLNREEALAFTQRKDVRDALRALTDAGAAAVCVTDGGAATWASDGGAVYHCGTISNSAIVDTTGAGDAFGCGATWAMLEGLDLPTALRAGTINATSVIGAIGAQQGLLTDTEMRKRLATTTLPVDEQPR